VIRPLESFSVSHRGLRLRVRLYASTRQVDRIYSGGGRRRGGGGMETHAFYLGSKSQRARHGGTIALPGNGRLIELVPHEVTHAVMDRLGEVRSEDDERLAYAVGVLSARIIARLRRKGYAV